MIIVWCSWQRILFEVNMDWKKIHEQAKATAQDIAHKSSHFIDQISDSKLADHTRQVTKKVEQHSRQAASGAKDWAQEQYAQVTEDFNETNWYLRAAKACESASDAILRERSGTSAKISRAIIAKLGMAGTTAGIFSIATLIGSASTGTAIGSLSGAAFTSAALAWVGGSVAMGTVIVGAAGFAGGIAAVLGAVWVSKKVLYGEKRQASELGEQERRALDACLALSAAFREKNALASPIDPASASHLHAEALTPLHDALLEIRKSTNDWPQLARHRLDKAITDVARARDFLADWSDKRPYVATGVIGAVLIRLMGNDLDDFDDNEQLVLQALRRSKSTLMDASDEALSEYVQSLETSQLPGMINNVKGIYHELRFLRAENTDGDPYIAELFEATNHPGADIKITNLETGEVREIQLKATNYVASIREHNEKYESIDVFATSEVAGMDPDIQSTGMSNEDITNDTEDVISVLGDASGNAVASSMAVAGMITVARNVRVLLKGKSMTKAEKQRLVNDGVASAGVAGLMALLLG
jgi:hypothetical protein